MDGVGELREQLAKATYVQEIERVIDPLSASPPTQRIARQLIDDMVATDLRRLVGSPTAWFNFSQSAGRSGNYGAMEKILQVAIEKHPEDVDLRCEWFQFSYGRKSIADALDAREKLEALGLDNTATYWRYWCYNATFESQYLGNKKEAVRLLNTALNNVPPAGLLNVFRQYRLVLIDGKERPSLSGDKSADHLSDDKPADHDDPLQQVADKYRQGLSLCIESGYVLAVDFARLVRERTLGMTASEADKALDWVLDLLNVAERTYTGDMNHPLAGIYREKAIALMARRRYEDALQIFRSLPEYQFDDPSLSVMAQYAANMTGQEFKPIRQQASAGEDSELRERVARVEHVLQQIVSELTGSGGEET